MNGDGKLVVSFLLRLFDWTGKTKLLIDFGVGQNGKFPLRTFGIPSAKLHSTLTLQLQLMGGLVCTVEFTNKMLKERRINNFIC